VVELAATTIDTEPSIVRFKKTLEGLEGTLKVLTNIKLNHFYCEVNLETIDTAISAFEDAVVEYNGYIEIAEGKL